jgi:flagellar M-ring protein FliF
VQQLFAVWMAIDLRRRVIVVVATAAAFAAVLMLASVAGRPGFALLYSGLDATRAGEVVAAIEQRGVLYDVRGDAIYVEAARRDELRMTLAAEGLPAAGNAGYELLDQLSGFGTTAQMFDAAYWRAKEGELARTIAANPQVRAARVHISNQEAQGLRPAQAAKASVTVTLAGSALPAAQAKAIKFLVSSAVAGLRPEDVAVIDADRGLVQTGDDAGAGTGGDDRAQEMRANVLRLLEARVGAGNVVVEVAAETVTEREAITERTFDPDGRVAISTDTEEKSTSANDSSGSEVTVASNLPQGDAAGSCGASQSQNSETRERVNFEVSETTREVLRSPGAIRRVSVAVLVNSADDTDAAGQVSQVPRTDEELALLRDLVASAVGFDEGRGDVITIRSLPFQPVADLGTEATGGFLGGIVIDVMAVLQTVVFALVALVLGLFVIRPILTGRNLPLPAPATGLPAPGRGNAAQGARSANGPGAALNGVIDDDDFVPPNMAVVSDFGRNVTGLPAPGTEGDPADPVVRLRRMVAERQDETVEILRGWIEQPAGGRAG